MFNQGVRIHVYDPSEKPVAGARVKILGFFGGDTFWNPVEKRRHECWQEVQYTDERGFVEFSVLTTDPGQDISFWIHADGFSPANLSTPPIVENKYNDLVLHLEPAWVLEGWVRGLSPQALADTILRCEPYPALHPEDAESDASWSYVVNGHVEDYTLSFLGVDAEGHFRFPCAPACGAKLIFSDEFRRYEEEQVILPPNSPPVVIQARKIPAKAKGKLEIRFTEHAAWYYQVSFRNLSPHSTGSEPKQFDMLSRAVERNRAYPFPVPPQPIPYRDADAHRLWMVPVGTWEVSVVGRSPTGREPPQVKWPNERAVFTITIEEDQEYSVTPDFKEGGVIYGLVQDASTGRALQDVKVSLIDSGAGAQAGTINVMTDLNGSFTLVGIVPGSWEYSFHADGYEDSKERLTAMSSDPSIHIIRLKKKP